MYCTLFCRFGQHYDFIKEFLHETSPNFQKVKYHVYTALQLSFPDIYTTQYALNQVYVSIVVCFTNYHETL